MRGWGISLAIAILIATSFKSAIADWNDVPTGSMIPTILAGDRIFVNKLAYDLKVPYTTWHLARWDDPVGGDIVVFYSPQDGKRLVKRIIGVPGDTIALRSNRLQINGKTAGYARLETESAPGQTPARSANEIIFEETLEGRKHPVMITPVPSVTQDFGPITVPAGSYFMMGDNRDASFDSRFFGFVKRTSIVGRATTIVLSRDGSFLHPRWHRFFKKLS